MGPQVSGQARTPDESKEVEERARQGSRLSGGVLASLCQETRVQNDLQIMMNPTKTTS